MTARDKIKPLFDVPLVFELEQTDGQEVPSKFTGLEYRFSVIFEARPAYIYLPVEGRNAILSIRPQAGELIELVKQKSGNQLYFRAQRLSDAYDEEPPAPAARNGTPRHAAPQTLNRGAYYRREEPGANPPPLPPRQALPAAPAAAPPASHAQSTGQAMPPRPEAPNVSPLTQRMAGCLRVAYDAWEEVRAYARSKGGELTYTSEDVRATGLSIYINAVSQKGGGR